MTPTRRRDLVITAVLLLSTACGGSAVDGGTTVTDAWARPTPSGASVAAIYFRLETADDDRLVSAAVDPSVAVRVELHATSTDGSTGAAEMRALDGVPVGAGEALTFEPGGHHVMLIGLPAPLVDGARFDVTLQLQGAGPQVVEVVVREDAP